MEKELNIDWANLSFGYIPTDYNVRCTYKNGEWGEIEVSSSELIPMHMAASCLHYGQEAFEGLKAFRGKDGQVRVFRMDENAKRIQRSAEGIMMPVLPVEKFMESRSLPDSGAPFPGCHAVRRRNRDRHRTGRRP